MDFFILQNLVKRDPETYKTEFLRHWEHFVTITNILNATKSFNLFDFIYFKNLVAFLSHCIPSYQKEKNEFEEFANFLKGIISNHKEIMETTTRLSLLTSLSLFYTKCGRNKLELLEFYFKLLSTEDSTFLSVFESQIFNFIRLENKKSKNVNFNKSTRNLINEVLNEINGGPSETIKTVSFILKLLISLFQGCVWKDSHTLDIISNIILKFQFPSILFQVCDFFVSDSNKEEADESDQEEIEEKYRELRMKMRVSGKKKSLESRINRIHRKKKKESKKKIGCRDGSLFALEELRDPLSIVHTLYACFKRGTNDGQQISFQSRLLILNALTRIIGIHQLLVPDLYSFIYRYVRPNQIDLPKILAYIAQSFHPQVPEDITKDFISCLSLNLVSDHCSSESIAIGINTIREISRRQPAAITSEALFDLSQYSSFKKDKAVKAAAKSLIGLFREVEPSKLHKKYLGRPISNKKISDSESSENEDGNRFLSPEAVEAHTKLHDYDSRMLSILKGRSDRNSFGSKKRNHTKKHIGKTNKFKIKNKPRMLLKHKRKLNIVH
jgi:protein SDA1